MVNSHSSLPTVEHGKHNDKRQGQASLYRFLYEKDLKKRQKGHLERVAERRDQQFKPCLHDFCQECHGTGVKLDGSPCTHMISCTCQRCSRFTL